jgi:Co/Zn/Cd efflux system component
MAMSDDERRQLRELEAEVAQQRRLVKLARQLGSASVYTGLRRITVLWIAGGSIGLILVVAGAVVHSNAMLIAAVVVLAGTLILVGVASLVVEVAGYRREHRSGDGRQFRPPSSRSG